MSNLCFFVSSSINLDDTNHIRFSYSPQRSAFNAEERFRQTQFTINSIRLLDMGKIYLVDVSENWEEYANRLNYVPNLEFIPIHKFNPELANQCRTNSAKGYCETLATKFFFDNYIDDFSSTDFLCKISGRYFYTAFRRDHFNENNLDKYLFKPLHLFEWKDAWQFPEQLKIDNKVKWIFTCTFGLGKYRYKDFKNGLEIVKTFYESDSRTYSVDYECAIPHFISNDNLLVDSYWHVGGWGGANGDFGVW